ncbi:MAG TPA: chemotaxis protein CheB [Dokdonella sp.]
MAERGSGIAVALLYETREHGAQLRETLASLGAPVVYEAPTHALDRFALERSHANVIVVNLEAELDPREGTLSDLLDDVRYRVVFNDGEVSSALSGWDRARWARHLAAKIAGADDTDPPRPDGAEAVPAPRRDVAGGDIAAADGDGFDADAASTTFAPAHATADADAVDAAAPIEDAEPAFPAPASDFAPDPPSADAATETRPATAVSDTPGAFDAFVEPPGAVPVPGHGGTGPSGGAELADFDELLASFEAAVAQSTEPEPAFDVDALGATTDVRALDDESTTDAIAFGDAELDEAAAGEAVRSAPGRDAADAGELADAVAPAVKAAVAPPEWSLEDMIDGPPPPSAPAGFGIETLSAAEFLAPPTDDAPVAPDDEPSFTLELIPLEDAVLPAPVEAPERETWLDAPVAKSAKVRRVWVLAASIGGPESVREFLAEFPRDFPALFVLAQHLGDEFVDLMTRQLAKATALTVRTPTHGERVGHGEIVVVPNAKRLRVDRDGVVVLEHDDEQRTYAPSIDRVLEDVAERFGAAAGAIVFSGMTADAIEGCRRLVASGGVVYAQDPATCVVSTMVDGVREAGLASFLGSPKELARKLLAESNERS